MLIVVDALIRVVEELFPDRVVVGLWQTSRSSGVLRRREGDGWAPLEEVPVVAEVMRRVVDYVSPLRLWEIRWVDREQTETFFEGESLNFGRIVLQMYLDINLYISVSPPVFISMLSIGKAMKSVYWVEPPTSVPENHPEESLSEIDAGWPISRWARIVGDHV